MNRAALVLLGLSLDEDRDAIAVHAICVQVDPAVTLASVTEQLNDFVDRGEIVRSAPEQGATTYRKMSPWEKP